MVAAKTHPKWKTEAPGGRQPKLHVWAFFWVARGTSFLWRPSFPLPVFPSISSRNCPRKWQWWQPKSTQSGKRRPPVFGNQNSMFGPSFGWHGGLLSYGDHPSHCQSSPPLVVATVPGHGKLNRVPIFSSAANLRRPLGPTEKRKLILCLN